MPPLSKLRLNENTTGSENPNPDLIGDLSDWSCDVMLCGITGTGGNGLCPACERRQRVATLFKRRNLEKRPCTLDCTPLRPCERCREVNEYLTLLFLQREEVAVLLRALRQLAGVFPDEFRELLAGPVADIFFELEKRK